MRCSKKYLIILKRNRVLIKWSYLIITFLVSGYLKSLNAPIILWLSVQTINLCLVGIIQYFLSPSIEQFRKAINFCRKHGWKNLILLDGEHYLAFPPRGVMPVPLQIVVDNRSELDPKYDLADVILMPIFFTLVTIIKIYIDEKIWWQSLISFIPFILVLLFYTQIEELIFKNFIKLHKI